MLFSLTADENPDWTAAHKAIYVYKYTMLIEFMAVAVALFFALFFGYLYEVWSRRAVLILSFFLLFLSMIQPILGWLEGQVMFAISRIASCVLVQAIM